MNKMLSQICEYDLIVVEQSEKYLFNIGKLKNIGFDYLNKHSKKKYYNYIFADIDTLPDSDLIQYFFKKTDSINGLATKGTRYESLDNDRKKPFCGALVTCTKKIFEDLNGYPNNFYGWQGEDDNLLLRLYAQNKPLYIVTDAKIIDIEEINGVKKKLMTKLDELKNLRNNHAWEQQLLWKNYKENGLSNLSYDILYSSKFEYKGNHNHENTNYHIIVDIEYEKDKEKYPNDYIFKNIDNLKKNYLHLLTSTINNIKQIDIKFYK